MINPGEPTQPTMTTPHDPKTTNTDSSSNPPRRKPRLLAEFPVAGPDDPIYKRGLQIGFVRALPPSLITALKEKPQSQSAQPSAKEEAE